jgi:hypothetical protein
MLVVVVVVLTVDVDCGGDEIEMKRIDTLTIATSIS